MLETCPYLFSSRPADGKAEIAHTMVPRSHLSHLCVQRCWYMVKRTVNMKDLYMRALCICYWAHVILGVAVFGDCSPSWHESSSAPYHAIVGCIAHRAMLFADLSPNFMSLL
jgi:hypothetical protein